MTNVGKESTDYQCGYQRGFNDEVLQWYQLRNYSTDFQCGYQAGQQEIQRLIDEHIETRH